MKLSEDMAGWQEWYDALVEEIIRHGGEISDDGTDELHRERRLRLSVVPMTRSQDIGDMLVRRGCQHIYRLHRLCADGFLERRTSGEHVFYSLPTRRVDMARA